MELKEKPVYTPLGRGMIVWEFPDGSLAVQFDHGGGQIFCREELMIPPKKTPLRMPNAKNSIR